LSNGDSNELEAIKAKKILEFQRRMVATQKPEQKKEVDDMTLVRSKLVSRGDEVLDAALSQYPQATMKVVQYIAKLYKTGRLDEPIPGDELLALFHDLGMRVRLETTITYIKDGKRVSLSEKFKKSDY
jgi:DNA-binding TFAR19-related protein (PDSD5 family)